MIDAPDHRFRIVPRLSKERGDYVAELSPGITQAVEVSFFSLYRAELIIRYRRIQPVSTKVITICREKDAKALCTITLEAIEKFRNGKVSSFIIDSKLLV